MSGRPGGWSSAIFSPCGTYRYHLARRLSEGENWCTFVMLNPSTADAETNDPTIERCERRAREWGHNGVFVVNLFALRSTDPGKLKGHPNPVGPENDRYIGAAALAAKAVVCGWGEHGALFGRGAAVRTLLDSIGVRPQFLKLNRSGAPAHPLYLPYSLRPQPWVCAGGAA